MGDGWHAEPPAEPTAVEPALEEIVITSTKKEHAENVQEVPSAMTAYDSRQLEAQRYQNLTSLAYTMPNVSSSSSRCRSA
jgi:iron complex outermembrane recepter protein